MTIAPSAHHPDPLGEAFSHSSQKAAQFISMAGAAYEIAARRRAIRAARDAARTEHQLHFGLNTGYAQNLAPGGVGASACRPDCG